MANINLTVVDDEEDIRFLFEMQFRKEIKSGIIALQCLRSGKVAMEYLASHPVQKNDMMLLDINMPGMSGLELLKIVKEHYALPVFMITAYNNTNNLRMAYQYGADDFISKPIDFVLLKQKILRYFMSL